MAGEISRPCVLLALPVVELATAVDECEQIVTSLAAAVTALIDKDAELLGQWRRLKE